MKRAVISITPTSSLGEAAALIIKHHIGMLPVVDDTAHLLGLVQLRDLLALVMPDFVRLIEDFDFVHDFGAVERQQPARETLARQVQEMMQPPVSVEEDCGLMRAFALLRHHDLHDLPVVSSDGRLIGIVSRVDIGVALLSTWQLTPTEESP